MKGRAKAEAGYALVWAVVTMIIAAIMIAGTLFAGQAYASRNLGEAVSNQAYLTARSAAEAIAAKIDGTTATCLAGETPDYNNPLLPADGATISINGSSFDFPAAMGTIDEASITRNGDQIIVSASASKGGETATVKISILHTMELVDDSGVEPLPVYLSGFCGLYAGTKLTFNKDNTLAVHVNKGDIYAASLTFSGSRVLTDLIVGGTFYVKNATSWKSRLKGNATLQEYPGELPFSDTTHFPADPVKINGSKTIDLTGGDEIYYEVQSTISATTVLKIDGDHDYYIRVPSNKTCNLTFDVAAGEPRVFIITAGTLNIKSTDGAYLYVYGTGGTISIDNGVTMQGAIFGETVTLKGNLDLTYVSPDESGGALPGSSTESHRWDNDKYLFQ